MKPDRHGKKSDTVKFRVPWTLKRDFMARARDEGRPASDIFRDFMEDYLQRPAQRTTQTLETAMTVIKNRPRATAGAAAIIGAAAISALLSGAIPAGAAAPHIEAGFAELDADGDGVISEREFTHISIGSQQSLLVDPVSGEVHDGDISSSWSSDDPVRRDRNGEPIWWGEGFSGFNVLFGDSLTIRRTEVGGGPGAAARMGFGRADHDGDGVLSLAEFEARFDSFRNRAFVTLDADHDLHIEAAEAGQLAEPLLAALDADADGQISGEEFSGAIVLGFGLPRVNNAAAAPAPVTRAPGLEGQFDRMDSDDDGAISFGEYRAPSAIYRLTLGVASGVAGDTPLPTQPILFPARPDGPPTLLAWDSDLTIGGDRSPEALRRRAEARSAEEMRDFAALDASGDDALSFAEFSAYRTALIEGSFATLDVNGDGEIAMGECAAAVGGFPASAYCDERLGEALRNADADGDGALTRAEYEAAL